MPDTLCRNEYATRSLQKVDKTHKKKNITKMKNQFFGRNLKEQVEQEGYRVFFIL